MAEITPFRAWRYDLDEVGEAASVLAPPYDVISEQERQQFLARHPNNIVRLTLGVDPLGSPLTASRYELARSDYCCWKRDGTLKRVDTPCFHIYEQEYTPPVPRPTGATDPVRRRGVIGAVKLHDYDDGVVLPHEGTLEEPKADRLRLMETTQCAFSQIFAIYSEPNLSIQQIADDVCRRAPILEVTDDADVKHRLWEIADQEICRRISQVFHDRQIVIADGHHRYETALMYRDRQRQQHGLIEEAPWEYTSMYLCNTEADQLTILPSHRLIKDLPLEAESAMWRSVTEVFDTERFPIDSSSDETRAEGVHELLDQMWSAQPGAHTFALYTGGNHALLLRVADDEPVMERALRDVPQALRDLDVMILHKLVIEDIMGLSGDDAATGINILYSRNGHEAANRVARGEASVVLYVATTRVDQVMSLATSGYFMPQKATYFYPKPLAGMVLHDLRLDR